MTRKTITRSQYFDQKQANKYLKIYPRDPYEEQNPHFVQSTELIQHFKAVQRDIRLRIDQCKSLMRKILLDRTEGKMSRQVDKLLPTESLLESNPLLHKQHKMEEKIAKVKEDFRKRMSKLKQERKLQFRNSWSASSKKKKAT
jgi:hypothetical protein